MAKRPFNGSPTVDGYYTTFDSSEVHRMDSSDEGGGGSSDFSTAEATIINNAENNFVLYFPNIFDGKVLPYLDSADIDGSPAEAVLYKGSCDISYQSAATLNINVSGNATVVNNIIIITGDCTITIS